MKEWLLKVGVLIIAMLAPIQSVIATVGILVLADMITGIWAAIKRKEAIKSAGLRRTVSKLIIYQTAIITGFLVETYLTSNLLPITKILGGIIGMVELKSILENSNTITNTDIFKTLIEKLGSQNDKKSE